jgi:hypothetical protein
MRTAWRIANAVMLVLFAASMLLQINDPDPFAWMAVYGAAAALCALELTGRLHAVYPALLALATLGWAATIAPRVLGKVPLLGMFAEFEMRDLGIEEAREMFGLVIVGGWVTLLAVVAARRRRMGAG